MCRKSKTLQSFTCQGCWKLFGHVQIDSKRSLKSHKVKGWLLVEVWSDLSIEARNRSGAGHGNEKLIVMLSHLKFTVLLPFPIFVTKNHCEISYKGELKHQFIIYYHRFYALASKNLIQFNSLDQLQQLLLVVIVTF